MSIWPVSIAHSVVVQITVSMYPGRSTLAYDQGQSVIKLTVLLHNRLNFRRVSRYNSRSLKRGSERCNGSATNKNRQEVRRDGKDSLSVRPI